MSENANRYAVSGTKANKATQKSRDRQQRRAAEQHAAQIAEIHTNFDLSGLHVQTLETSTTDHLRRYRSGYDGAKGHLQGLFKGLDMETALINNRTEYLAGVNHDTAIRDVFSLCTYAPMLEREREFKEKVGPFYLRPIKFWWKKVAEVFTHAPTYNNREAFVSQLQRIAREYLELNNGVKLSAVSVDESVLRMNTSANTGYPFFTSNWFKAVNFEGEQISPIEWGQRTANRILSDEEGSGSAIEELDQSHFVLFTRKMYRGTIDKDDLKASERPVQCSGILERMLGSGVQAPLMELQKRHRYSQGLRGVYEMGGPIKDAFERFECALEADYSGFDASIHPLMISDVFEHVIIPLFDEKDHPRLNHLKRHYETAKLWTPIGIISSDVGPGLMSGSMLTNCIGMIVGQAAWGYVVSRIESEYNEPFEHVAFGYSDDLAVFYNPISKWENGDSLGAIFAEKASELGLLAHTDKQKIWYGSEKQTSFLGHVFFPDITDENGCQPIYPIMRGLSKLIWKEYDDGDMVITYSADSLSYGEKTKAALLGRLDVSSTNPCHRELVEYINSHYKLTSGECANFLPDYSVSPSLTIFHELNGAGDQPECEPELTSDELNELEELLRLAKETPDGRRTIRRFIKQQRKFVKQLKKQEARDQYLEAHNLELDGKRMKSSAESSAPSQSHPSGPVEQLSPIGSKNIQTAEPEVDGGVLQPDEEHDLEYSIRAASPKKLRALILSLRAALVVPVENVEVCEESEIV